MSKISELKASSSDKKAALSYDKRKLTSNLNHSAKDRKKQSFSEMMKKSKKA